MIRNFIFTNAIIAGVAFTACKKVQNSPSTSNRAEAPVQAAATTSPEQDSTNDEADNELALTTSECKDNANLSQITLSPSGELFINDPEVLNDARAKNGGKWTFTYAMREILELPEPGTAPALLAVEDAQIKLFIAKVTGDEKVNSFSTTTRATTAQNLNSSWGKVVGSDKKSYRTFDKAPFKLVGIVNRLDLVKKGQTSKIAGEGRFVFGFTGAQPMTVILEYDLPIGSASTGKRTLTNWTKKWHNLKNFLVDTNPSKKGVQPDNTFPAVLKFKDKAGYLQNLQSITESFASRKARFRSGTTTQAAISQIRSNELSSDWSLREILRTYDSKGLATFTLTTVKNAPDSSFSEGQKGFNAWIEANVVCSDPKDKNSCVYNTPDGLLPNTIKNGATTVALAGARDVVTFTWFPSSVNVKQRFVALNTCGGCHQGETSTSFLHVDPVSAQPSQFLIDQINKPRTKNFKNLICLAAADKSILSLTDEDEKTAEKKLDLRSDFSFGVE